MVATLGCAKYEVYVQTAGGFRFLERIRNITELRWSRILNETSEMRVDFTLSGTDGDCCGVVSTINPWQHELAVFRDGVEVWCGPVTGGEIDLDTNTAWFSAKDLSAWFDKRWVEVMDTDVEFDEADILEVYEWLMAHAYNKDPWNMSWFFNAERLNIPISRTYIAYDTDSERWGGSYPKVGSELRDLRDGGMDFTVVRRVYLAGNLISNTTPVARLVDGDWIKRPKIIIVGNGMATEVGVGGGPGGYSGWYDDQIWIERPNDEYRAQFGLLQEFEPAQGFDEEDTYTVPNPITQRAYSLRELKKRPYEYVSGGALSPSANVTFDQLIPGRFVQVDIQQSCRTVIGQYMLTAVNVAYNGEGETVSVDMAPPGAEVVKG